MTSKEIYELRAYNYITGKLIYTKLLNTFINLWILLSMNIKYTNKKYTPLGR